MFFANASDRRSLAHYESGPMSQSALKKIAALRRCGGLLSRLAYERGRKEGVDVEVLLRQAHLTPHEIKNKKAAPDDWRRALLQSPDRADATAPPTE